MHAVKTFLLTLTLLISVNMPTQAASLAELHPILDLNSIFNPVIGTNGMVASQEALASQAGLDVLQQGGNAVDAAVAVGFALAVTLPKAGNIGGGGFMLIHTADGKSIAIDYREMAPSAAHRDLFIGKDGKVDNHLAQNSFKSSGVPGTVAGMIHALEKYGTMPLKKVIAPAIELAEKGFTMSHEFARELQGVKARLSLSKVGYDIFYKKDGSGYRGGELFKQPKLAWSLKQIAKHGKAAFYEGKIAKKLLAASKKHGGIMTAEDLKNYRVAEREALRSSYRGYDIISMPPPSSGGVHVLQMLNILKNFDLTKMGHNSADYLHTITEAMRYAYADRSKFLGDPDFFKVPVKALLSDDYANSIAKQIDLKQATNSDNVRPGQYMPKESNETTHYSVADRFGNTVSNTYTLNFSYGSGIVVDGAGFLMNNEMDDFSAKPGTPNAFGLLGGEANAIEPGKRPLSSMTPTIVLKDDKPYLVIGSPGGSKIITIVIQTLLNVVDHNMNIAEANSMPRIHHQWYPDEVKLEPGISLDTQRLLLKKGHNIKHSSVFGSAQSIMIEDGLFYGSSDPRRPGAAAVGY